ncbi:MAG: cobalt ECF transporter T component CbiQ [Candidatus Promineifilaceae bacterium]
MHIHLADQYRSGSSIVHRRDPRIKVGLTLLFILTASLLPFGEFWAYLVLFLAIMVVAAVSGVGAGFILKRSFVALPFALAAVTLPFTVQGQTLLTIPILGGITVTVEGTIRFVSILMKSWISVQAAILLVSVTPFPDLLWGLRALHIPQPLVSIVSFMYRYLFVLSDEVLRMMRARSSRSATIPGQKSGGSILWRGKVAGRMAGSLMLRSFERSERIYNAMTSRGFQGTLRTLSRPGMNSADYAAFVVGILFLGAILAASFI